MSTEQTNTLRFLQETARELLALLDGPAPGDDVDHDDTVRTISERLANEVLAHVPFASGRMYAVAPTYERRIDEHTTREGQVPTFYLHPNAQGILNEDQATRIARDILAAGTDPADGITYHVRAYEV